MATPDYILDSAERILTSILPLFRRTPGGVADAARYASYRRKAAVMLADTRAAARSGTLVADLADIAEGYREASSDMRAVVAGLERIAVATRAFVVAQQGTPPLASVELQRQNEMELLGLIEALALVGIARALATMRIASHDEASRLRARMGRLFDTAIERASEAGRIEVMRELRALAAAITRDMIERGRPLARIVGYETGVPLPSVVLAHMLYQDAGRAEEIRRENARHDHPSFMPTTGRVLSR